MHASLKNRRSSILCLLQLTLLIATAIGGYSQTTYEVRSQDPAVQVGDQQNRPPYTLSVNSNLVLLDVLVTDEDGKVLAGLNRNNFRILDDGKPQVINSFEPTDDPITIVLLLEYSSVAYNYFAYKGAYWSSSFLDHLDERDWVALVTYDMKPSIQVDFTRNKAEVRDALGSQSFPTFGEVNLFAALIDTLDNLDRVQGKKAVLLISTGFNSFSNASLDDAVNRVKRSDASIFCIGVAESEYLAAEVRGGSGISYLQAKSQLQQFADLSGGLAWFPRFEGELPELFKSVVGFLRSEYDLGFSPPREALDGKYHKLKVEIVGTDGAPLRVINEKGKRRKVVAYARQGYVAKLPNP